MPPTPVSLHPDQEGSRSGGKDESSCSDSAAYLLSNEFSAGMEHSKDGQKDLDEDSASLVASSRGLQ